MNRCVLVLLLMGVLVGRAHAQSTESSPPPATDTTGAADTLDADWLVLPFLSFAPTTGVSGGIVGGYYRPDQDGQPGSSVQMTVTVTQKRQLIVQASPELYLDQGRWRGRGELEAAYFPDAFYGIGGETPDAAKENFTSRYVRADLTAQRRVRPNLRVGPRVLVRAGTVTDADSAGLIAQGQVPGADGAVTAGLGAAALWDARDNRYYPTSGSYAEVAATLHSALWGSDYTFGQIRTDLRGYRTLGVGVLAGQVYTESVAGTAPFQSVPVLGGPDRMRGYRKGRFRDNVYWATQAEYRFPLFWRLKGTAFAAVGEVGPRLGASLVRGMEAAVGLGGRFRFTDGGVHGRMDIAYSDTGVELYLSLGEAF